VLTYNFPDCPAVSIFAGNENTFQEVV